MSILLPHPSLGRLRGVSKENEVQFRGIKYATLKNRFAKAELFNGWALNKEVDTTNYGPCTPAPMACDMEFSLIQASLPKPPMSISDVDCLNLNVTLPALRRDNSDRSGKTGKPAYQNLPVVVVVHGGNFQIGSSCWPQYDLARMVKLSLEMGKPIIGVGINYRLGATGFLTSEELRKAGCSPNNGLRDQITAFQWVKKHIGGFGGDPNNVTFLGQSAGAAAGCLLLHHKEPLFRRFVNMAATTLLLRPLPLAMAEAVYQGVIKALGIADFLPQDRVQALHQLPLEQFFKINDPHLLMMPVEDGDIIPSAMSFKEMSDPSFNPGSVLPGMKWCETLMIGDCQFDAMVYTTALTTRPNSIIAPSFIQTTEKVLSVSPDAAKALLSAYNITPFTSSADAIVSILRFATDIGFYAPTITWCRAHPGQSYLYRFNVPNPWDGPYKGEATHVQDLMFCLMNYEEKLSEDDKKVSRALARDVVKFLNGEEPWEAFVKGKKEGSMVYGPAASVEYVSAVDASKEGGKFGRRSTVFEICEREKVGLDDIFMVWMEYLTT